MANDKGYNYTPLSESEEPEASSLPLRSHSFPHHKRSLSRFFSTSLVLSLLLNLLLITTTVYKAVHHRSTDSTPSNANGAGISPYTGLGYNTQYRFDYFNDYWSTNETLADELWDSIDTDSLVVALDQHYISTHNLPSSNPFPWDPSKGLYYLKSFHLLHCLKHLRKVITDYRHTNATSLSSRHTFHCLDIYRQYTLCHADDTPMPARYSDDALGDQQVLQCRSMDRLREWSKRGDRNACFRMVDEFKPAAHTLEKYQYCEAQSPYYGAMREYFEAHGHKALFKGEE
ncbi:hypothetical protein MMC28_006427 [Mycoblastus sanguinarius]|nr:hypothetical protein [Mycoblastus sanguinarius]